MLTRLFVSCITNPAVPRLTIFFASFPQVRISSLYNKRTLYSAFFERKYKTRREAKEVELKLSIDIKNAKSGKSHINIKNKGEIIFKKFYEDIWLEPYKAGQTTTTIKPPTKATVFQTENIFRLHILPILGKYSIEYPNNNKQLILSLLTPKANSYANFKVIRSYVNSVFDWAEELRIYSIK